MDSTPFPRLRPLAFSLLALLAALTLSTFVRIHTTLADPGFSASDPKILLKSDPGLLHYLTSRIRESTGLLPADFRGDPRIQHPRLTDVPAQFTVGQEFLVAWTHRLFGGDTPLHLHALWVMSLVSSLAGVAIFGLILERTRSPLWSALGVLLFVLLPANYRTIGFLYVREDLSFPLFAIHLWLLARAARLRTPVGFLLSGLALAAALATWHAMVFVVALEALAFFALLLWSGESPLGAPRTWLLLVPPAVAGVLVPALQAKMLLLSLPLQIALALVVAGRLGARPRSWRVAAALATWLAVAALSFALARWLGGGAGDQRHVFDVVLAKLVHLGRLPADPGALSFDARLLWQGPFATLDPGWGLTQLLGGLILGVPALIALARGRLDAREPADLVLALLTLFSLVAAWLVGRMVILPGLLLPVLAAVWLQRLRMGPGLVGCLGAVLLVQALSFAGFVRDHVISWYLPPGQGREIAALVDWIEANLPPDEPIVADFVTSTAILAHTRRPIVLQPKYETDLARRRAEAFLVTFFHGTPGEMATLVRGRFASRYVLFDRYTLGWLSPYTAGLRAGEQPRPGTAASVFLGQDDDALAGVPGFQLVYRSPPTILQRNGEPYDLFRLYRVSD